MPDLVWYGLPDDPVQITAVAAVRALAVLEAAIAEADSYEQLRDIELKARFYGRRFPAVTEVRLNSQRVVILAMHQIAERLLEMPVSVGAATQRASRQDAGYAPATLQQLVGSQRRGVQLRKFGSISRSWVVKLVEAVHSRGADITISFFVLVVKVIEGLPDDLREKVLQLISQGVGPMEARRLVIGASRIGALRMPTDKYRVIYADPPWSYGNTQMEGFREQRDHYPVMPMDEICALPVLNWADDNAVLFLWVTSPILFEAEAVIAACGFVYKANFIWDKVRHVMGHYNSVRHELLLICTRGSCQPDVRQLFDSVYVEERTEHSRKPEHFRTVIDTLYPHGKRIELFARGEVPDGWDVYGNEAVPGAA
jgi:N6-adenosine-specific RNA methylase IME4